MGESLKVCAPLPLGVHLTICIVATIFYLYMFSKKKYPHHLMLVVAFDLTLIAQTNITRGTLAVLGIIEAVLIVLMIVSYVYVSRKNSPLKAEPEKVIHENIVDNAFENDDNNNENQYK